MTKREATHTPGPWRFNERDDYRDGGEVVAEPPYQTIRVCEIPYWLAAPEEMRANAALIAAAPDLKDAATTAEAALGENLNWLADALDIRIRQGDGETLRRLDQLNSAWQTLVVAIARAEGNQS